VGASKIVASLFNEGIGKEKPLALLDNSPLRDFLSGIISFDNIQHRIDAGDLDALCITALGYSSGDSVSFFQGNQRLRGWRRYRRVGTPTQITVDHLNGVVCDPNRVSNRTSEPRVFRRWRDETDGAD